MKIEKAIEILTDITQGGAFVDNPDEADAIKLGIEALKEVQRSRPIFGRIEVHLLPGETKT